MPDTPRGSDVAEGRRRVSRHLTWIVPLLLAPVLYLGLGVAYVIDRSDVVPGALVPLLYLIPVIGSIAAFVVFIVAAVRMMKGRRRKPRLYARLAQQDAARRGLTSEEYGVYKGSVGSAVEPVNSAGGLLAISLILTAIGAFVLVMIGILIVQSVGLLPAVEGDTELTPVMWFFVLLSFASIPCSWWYYAKERRAQKLRISRGLPPTLR